MPYCPKCKSEYRDGFTRCYDCEVELVDSMPQVNKHDDEDSDSEISNEELTEEQKQRETIGKVKPQPEMGSEVPLITVDNQVQYVYITTELEKANIPYRVMERDAGNYLTIYMGVSYTGRTIYVDKKNFKEAEAIALSYDAKVIEE